MHLKLGFRKVGLLILVVAMVLTGYFIYIKGLAASESITLGGCNKLQQERQWHIEGPKCVGPNGVALAIIR